jgi:hypothetical protein
MIHTRTKIVAVIALIFFIGTLVSYGVFFGRVEDHKAALAAERLRAAESEAQRKALSTLEATVASSQGSREKLSQFILKDEEIIELLSLIERTAREQQVTVTTKSLTVNPHDAVFEELQASFNAEGSFDGVMRMLRILEALPQQSTISEIMLTRTDKEDVRWQASFDLRVTKFKKNENQ